MFTVRRTLRSLLYLSRSQPIVRRPQAYSFPHFKMVASRNMSTSINGNNEDMNGYLHASITTGSTPEHFVSPPDKPEYHPYRLPTPNPASESGKDWQDDLELETATMLASQQASPLRFLVLYGSLRQTSYSRLLAFEMARLLEVSLLVVLMSKYTLVLIYNTLLLFALVDHRVKHGLQKMGAEVRMFDPSWLPLKHDREPVPEIVQELRNLSLWS